MTSIFNEIRGKINKTRMSFYLFFIPKVAPTTDQIEILLTLSENIQNLKQVLFIYMLEAFKKAKFEITVEDIQKTFYLSAIELKRNKEDIWVVLEHNGISSDISNFIPRFTIKNQKIVWSNVK
ncbi:MAG: hypothetical protein ACI976_001927 [Aureispira sp.]|jgi:hypothetical protein